MEQVQKIMVCLCLLLACAAPGGCRYSDTKLNGTGAANAASNTTGSKAAPDQIVLSLQQQREAGIEVAPVELGSALVKQHAKGRIVLPDNAKWRVGVLAEGRIEQVYANVGDYVQKGQLLARMHSHDMHVARAAYGSALAERSRLKAAEALAQKNYDRSQRLYALKAESLSQTEAARQELVNAQSATKESEITVDSERAHLEEILGVTADLPVQDSGEADLIPIKAPASGRILEKYVTPGATISPSNDAFVIGNLDRLWMLASVDAATLSKLRIGQPATVLLPDVPNASFKGKITNLGQEFDPVTRLMQIRIELMNTDNRLRPEMLASADIPLGKGQSAVLIPEEAVQQINGQNVVFTRIGQDRFAVRTVQVGENIGGKVRILDGLKPDEQVITHGSFIAKSQLLRASIGD
ncbi:MAG: efflux RND transporter periplasmic adaptor subunit [Acidobacteriaceae bacterium]